MNKPPDWFVTGPMALLVSAYPSWACSEGTVLVFWMVLADLPREHVEQAAVALAAQDTAWPTAAALRKLAKSCAPVERLTASEAWEEMYRHRHAHTLAPKWSSPAVERAAVAVNWNDPNWLTEQLPTIRAQFERYFVAIEKRVVREELTAEAESLVALSMGGALGARADGPRRLFGSKGVPSGS